MIYLNFYCDYSLDSLLTLDKILEYASEGAVGINATSFNGIIHFIYKAKSKNIKPILSFSMTIDNIKCLIIPTNFSSYSSYLENIV